MSLEDDYNTLDSEINSFIDTVHEKAVNRYKHVDTSNSSETLAGETPEYIKNLLKEIITEHKTIKGRNVHGQTPEDIGTLSTAEIVRYFDSRLSPDSNLPISSYGDCTYLGLPIGNPDALPIHPDIMFPNAFMEMDDLGNLYIVRAYGDGNESYPYFSVLTNARDNHLGNVKSTSNCIQVKSNSSIDPTRITNGVVGFNDDEIYFSTRKTNRALQAESINQQYTQSVPSDPIGYKVAVASLSPTERDAENMTIHEISVSPGPRHGWTPTKAAIRSLHRVKATNKTYFIGYVNGFTLDRRRQRYVTGWGSLEFFNISGSELHPCTSSWNLGNGWEPIPAGNNNAVLAPFATSGLDTTITFDDNHTPLFFDYNDSSGVQRIAMFIRFKVTPVNKIHPPYSFYVRMDPIVTANGNLDFTDDMSVKPTLEYTLAGFKWLTETGAPFKHQKFLRLLESHNKCTVLFEKNVCFIYDVKLEGSEFKLSRFRFSGEKNDFIKNKLPIENLETERMKGTELEFPTREVRVAGGLMSGWSGDKRITKGLTTSMEEHIWMDKSIYYIEHNEAPPGFSHVKDGKWYTEHRAYRHEMNVGNYSMTSFFGKPFSGPLDVVDESYSAVTGEEFISNPTFRYYTNSSGATRTQMGHDRIISDLNGEIPLNHPPLKSGPEGNLYLGAGVSSSLKSQIVPYLPVNRTMFTYELSQGLPVTVNGVTVISGWSIIRYIVPVGTVYKCRAMLVPYSRVEAGGYVTSVTLDFSKMTSMIDPFDIDVKPDGLGGRTGGMWFICNHYHWRDEGLKRNKHYVTESFEITGANGERYSTLSAWEPDATGKAIPTMDFASRPYPLDTTWAFGLFKSHVIKKIPSKYGPTWDLMRIVTAQWYGLNKVYGIRLYINTHSTSYSFSTDLDKVPDFSNGGIISRNYVAADNTFNVRSHNYGSDYQEEELVFCFGSLIRRYRPNGGTVIANDYINKYTNRINTPTDVFINGKHGEVGGTTFPENNNGWVNYGVWVQNDNGTFKYVYRSSAYSPLGFNVDGYITPPPNSVFIGYFTLDDRSKVVYSEVEKAFLVDGIGVSKLKRGSSVPRSGDFSNQLNKLGWS